MTAVPLGLSNYVRKLGRTPPVILKNMFVEKDPTNLVDGYVRLQRPALTQFAAIGTGPVRGIFKQLGTFDGDFLALSGTILYRVTEAAVQTVIGSVVGTKRAQFAASPARCLIVAGGNCYSTDGVTVSRLVMPNNIAVRSVAYINGYFVLVQDASQRFYWIAPGQTAPDALSFASAENSPDNIQRVEHIGDELWFFGEGDSTEVWVPTGNLDLPFQRVEGRLYDQGCCNRDTVAKLDNTLFWVGSDSVVYRADTVPTRISDNSIEELIFGEDAANLRAWSMQFQGHEFYCLTIGASGTLVFDVSTGTWGEFTSYGRPSWRAHVGAQTSGNLIVAGDDELGILWRLDPEASNDNGVLLEREIMGGVGLVGNPQACGSFSVLAATGWGNHNPPGDSPVLQMRFSDDAGNTWSNWYDMPLGARGQFGREVAVTRLGTIRAPGRLFHLRMTDDAILRVNYARINEWQAA